MYQSGNYDEELLSLCEETADLLGRTIAMRDGIKEASPPNDAGYLTFECSNSYRKCVYKWQEDVDSLFGFITGDKERVNSDALYDEEEFIEDIMSHAHLAKRYSHQGCFRSGIDFDASPLFIITRLEYHIGKVYRATRSRIVWMAEELEWEGESSGENIVKELSDKLDYYKELYKTKG